MQTKNSLSFRNWCDSIVAKLDFVCRVSNICSKHEEIICSKLMVIIVSKLTIVQAPSSPSQLPHNLLYSPLQYGVGDELNLPKHLFHFKSLKIKIFHEICSTVCKTETTNLKDFQDCYITCFRDFFMVAIQPYLQKSTKHFKTIQDNMK